MVEMVVGHENGGEIIEPEAFGGQLFLDSPHAYARIDEDASLAFAVIEKTEEIAVAAAP